MRAYLANKMTGKPQMNFPWFFSAAEHLRVKHGIDVVSPAELDDPETVAAAMASPDGSPTHYNGQTWGDFLARDLKIIVDDGIEAIIVGPDWMDSKGARLETFVGHLLGLPILEYPTLKPVPRDVLAAAWVGSRVTLT